MELEKQTRKSQIYLALGPEACLSALDLSLKEWDALTFEMESLDSSQNGSAPENTHATLQTMAKLLARNQKAQAISGRVTSQLARQVLECLGSPAISELTKTAQGVRESAEWVQQVHELNTELKVQRYSWQQMHSQLMASKAKLQDKEVELHTVQAELQKVQQQVALTLGNRGTSLPSDVQNSRSERSPISGHEVEVATQAQSSSNIPLMLLSSSEGKEEPRWRMQLLQHLESLQGALSTLEQVTDSRLISPGSRRGGAWSQSGGAPGRYHQQLQGVKEISIPMAMGDLAEDRHWRSTGRAWALACLDSFVPMVLELTKAVGTSLDSLHEQERAVKAALLISQDREHELQTSLTAAQKQEQSLQADLAAARKLEQSVQAALVAAWEQAADAEAALKASQAKAKDAIAAQAQAEATLSAARDQLEASNTQPAPSLVPRQLPSAAMYDSDKPKEDAMLMVVQLELDLKEARARLAEQEETSAAALAEMRIQLSEAEARLKASQRFERERSKAAAQHAAAVAAAEIRAGRAEAALVSDRQLAVSLRGRLEAAAELHERQAREAQASKRELAESLREQIQALQARLVVAEKHREGQSQPWANDEALQFRLQQAELALASERELSESLSEELEKMQARLAALQRENQASRSEAKLLSDQLILSENRIEEEHQAAESAASASLALVEGLKAELEAVQGRHQILASELVTTKTRLKEMQQTTKVSVPQRAIPSNGHQDHSPHSAQVRHAEIESQKQQADARVTALEQELHETRKKLQALLAIGRESCNTDYLNGVEAGSAVQALFGALWLSEVFHTPQQQAASLASVRMLQAEMEHVLQSGLQGSAGEPPAILQELRALQDMQCHFTHSEKQQEVYKRTAPRDFKQSDQRSQQGSKALPDIYETPRISKESNVVSPPERSDSLSDAVRVLDSLLLEDQFGDAATPISGKRPQVSGNVDRQIISNKDLQSDSTEQICPIYDMPGQIDLNRRHRDIDSISGCDLSPSGSAFGSSALQPRSSVGISLFSFDDDDLMQGVDSWDIPPLPPPPCFD